MDLPLGLNLKRKGKYIVCLQYFQKIGITLASITYLVNYAVLVVFMTQGSGHLEFGIDTKTYQPSLLSNDSACLALLVGISYHKAGGNKASYTRYMYIFITVMTCIYNFGEKESPPQKKYIEPAI
jgi:hypothetical protein